MRWSNLSQGIIWSKINYWAHLVTHVHTWSHLSQVVTMVTGSLVDEVFLLLWPPKTRWIKMKKLTITILRCSFAAAGKNNIYLLTTS